ncbi:MAG: hypothetical protein K2Q45_03890 [Nitrosomonas sp.]|nr:hypothetical protein [Nitrosomonas sp.]
MQGAVFPRLFVGGGQSYYGPTAERDKLVVQKTAQLLFSALGNSIEIVTGGTAGIPEDFALAWHKAGGLHVLCVVSLEYEQEYLFRSLPFKHIIVGETQLKRRIAVTKLEQIKSALFVQGGKFSTHEMKLLEECGVPLVTFWGSGGAAGGQQPYENYVYTNKPVNPVLQSSDPLDDPEIIAAALVQAIKLQF